MAIIREEKSKEKPYTVISNDALGDESISNSARGLLCQLLSKPDNWVFNIKNLVDNTKDGRDAIYSDLRELRANGYIVKRPIRNEKGIIVRWQEFVYESPQEEAKEIYQEQKERREKSALKRAEAIIRKNQLQKKLVNEKSIVKNENTNYIFDSVNKKIVKKTTSNIKEPLITKANENMCTKTVIGDNPHETMDKSTYGESVNGCAPSGNLVNIINNELLSNDIVSTNTSSCSSRDKNTNIVKELVLNFTSSICELKRTTLPKFINLIKGLDIHFIKVLIEYCEEINILSFAGFKTVLERCILKNILTVEAFIKSINDHRKTKEKKMLNKSMNKNKKGEKKLAFTDYSQREYDFVALENQLLGWD